MTKAVLKKSLVTGLAAVTVSILTACGGGASSPSSGTVATSEGQFVDSPVQGLRYDAGSGVTGTTDADGKFRYVQGQDVRFFIGNTLFGIARGSEIITPAALAKRDNPTSGINSPALLNRLRLLQALDDDGVINDRITLPENLTLPGQPVLNFALDLADFTLQPVTGSLLSLLGLTSGSLPSEADALAHYERYTLQNFFQGCYVGNIRDAGDIRNVSQFALRVTENGLLSGSVPLSAGGTPQAVEGLVRGDGSIEFGPVGGPSLFFGELLPLNGQAVGVFTSELLELEGGLLTRNPAKFPSFDVSACNVT